MARELLMFPTRTICSSAGGGFEATVGRLAKDVGMPSGPIRGVGGMMRTRGTKWTKGGVEPVVLIVFKEVVEMVDGWARRVG
jgi:hypothetical protein